jgi:hypothetical protein
MASQKEKETSQDKLERKDKRKRIDESIEHCTHVLSVLLQKPKMWCHPTFRTVRECIQVMKANPQQFPQVILLHHRRIGSLPEEPVRKQQVGHGYPYGQPTQGLSFCLVLVGWLHAAHRWIALDE